MGKERSIRQWAYKECDRPTYPFHQGCAMASQHYPDPLDIMSRQLDDSLSTKDRSRYIGS